MISFNQIDDILVFNGVVDFRKSIDGLANLVQQEVVIESTCVYWKPLCTMCVKSSTYHVGTQRFAAKYLYSLGVQADLPGADLELDFSKYSRGLI